MSSSIPVIISSNEQTQKIENDNQSSIFCEEEVNSSQNFTSTPILCGEIQTENDHEDTLIKLIDELIHTFLNQTNQRSPYHSLFRWTFDDQTNFNYSVVIKIDTPSPMI